MNKPPDFTYEGQMRLVKKLVIISFCLFILICSTFFSAMYFMTDSEKESFLQSFQGFDKVGDKNRNDYYDYNQGYGGYNDFDYNNPGGFEEGEEVPILDNKPEHMLIDVPEEDK